MEDLLKFLRLGCADANDQKQAAKEIERLQSENRSPCPDDCPGRLKFYAKKGTKGRDWR